MAFAGFKLMFPIEQIDFWAAQYPTTWEDLAAEAGKKIREGDFSLANLVNIVRWKSETGRISVGEYSGRNRGSFSNKLAS